MAQYIYGIINRPSRKFSIDLFGIGGNPVELVFQNQLAAVVSKVVSGNDNEEASFNRGNILNHQKVVELAREKYGPILPVSFGTMMIDEQMIKEALLEKAERELRELLEEMKGKVQFEIKALWIDLGEVFQNIAQKDEEIRLLRKKLRIENVSLAEKIAIGKSVVQMLELRKEEMKGLAMRKLEGSFLNIRESAIFAAEVIFNLSFLVDEKKQKKFISRVYQLEEELEGWGGDKIFLKFSGPMAAYNFIQLAVASQRVSSSSATSFF